MTIRSRAIILSLSITTFVIISPILVLFARGYKFDFETKSLVKTGTLVARSEPNRAHVYLDDKEQTDTTPSTLRFIKPADYNISIKKDGYKAWTKRLNIKSELVTWANLNREFIALFLEQPKMVRETITTDVFKHPSINSLVAIENDKPVHFGQDGQNRALSNQELWKTIQPHIKELGDSNIYSLLSFNHNITFTTEQLAEIKKVESNSDFLVTLSGNKIDAYNQSGQLFYIGTGSNFTLDGNDLWLIQNTEIRKINLYSKESNVILSDITAPNIEVIRGEGNIFVILGKALYILNDGLDLIYNNIDYAEWSDQGEYLVYGNTHELFLFTANTQRSTLILRSSTDIFEPVVNSETGYVFFENERKIKTIEIDGRDHRNVYEITDAGNGYVISDNGRLLTVYTQTGIKTWEIR